MEPALITSILKSCQYTNIKAPMNTASAVTASIPSTKTVKTDYGFALMKMDWIYTVEKRTTSKTLI